MKHDLTRVFNRWLLPVLLLAPAGPVFRADAQPLNAGRPGVAQVGLGAVPGLGLQAGYVAPRSVITTEGMLYVDVTPSFGGGEGSVQISAGIGGALRPLRLARLLTGADPPSYDLDFGLRFGPGLFFAFNETRARKNQRFSLFLDPYARFSSALNTRRTFFIEAGIQRPILRAGIWVDI